MRSSGLAADGLMPKKHGELLFDVWANGGVAGPAMSSMVNQAQVIRTYPSSKW